MDLIDYYYYAVNVLIFLSSLKKVIVISYDLLHTYFEEYFRIRRLKKVIRYYDE